MCETRRVEAEEDDDQCICCAITALRQVHKLERTCTKRGPWC